MSDLVTLYRPVGPAELELVRASGFRRWPPRLAGQPIFYPVANLEYAREIAGRWNVEESGFGAVLSFQLPAEFIARYPLQTVGSARHQEWWIPAQELEELNDAICGEMKIIWRSDQPSN
jgi:hypothetical protein